MFLFSFLVVLATRSAWASRPEVNHRRLIVNRQQSQMIMRDLTVLRDLLQDLVEAEALDASGVEGAAILAGLYAAKEQTDIALLQVENATEHTDAEAEETLGSVVDIINVTIYGSMDHSHDTEQARLNDAAKDIDGCNEAIAARLADGGDIYHLESEAREYQRQLTELRHSLMELNFTNRSAWQHVHFYSKFLPHAPQCPDGYASKTTHAIGDFVDSGDYKDQLERQRRWFEEVKEGFSEKYITYQAAHQAIITAQESILQVDAKLRLEYCVWQLVLKQGCAHFDECYQQHLDHFNEVTKAAKANEKKRIAAFKAGETVIAHVGYLLAHRDFPDGPVRVDTRRFELEYPRAPHQRSCETDFHERLRWEDDLECDEDGADPLVKGQDEPGKL